ncbi:leucyl aminopeptidase [Paenibacillus thiaminolyticus]|uniref:leucyl aminopeptidase n=1 Tax=Paenibacillus thiaminolyticus TaxID=49283 RepID=UPI001162149B|nr:leucyl aminopeptidase [Paenibacillus thiaminolyticus]NGP57830.1 leucyl aminopeptidase [Paenibacillus thiaminolyticus]WCR26999.1 leucyl aminopeptidase [Paenibacillus thiaminolyticus]
MNLSNVAWLDKVTIQTAAKAASDIEADGIVVIGSRSELEQASGFPGAEACQAAVKAGLFEAGCCKTYVTATGQDKAPVLIAVGRKDEALAAKQVRLMLAEAAREAVKLKLSRIAVIVPDELKQAAGEEAAAMAHVMVEGFLLGAYQRVTYKKDAKPIHCVEAVTLAGENLDEKAWNEGAVRGQAYAYGTAFARDLTNLPGNVLYPSRLAETAMELAKQVGFEAHVLDEKEIEAKGMGALLGVGKGSSNPPRMIALKYQGKPEWTDVCGLVGKGITFDTGGISLKRAGNMDEMICDMGGSAAVLGAMAAIGRLKPQVNVVCVVASAENMPAGNALKPGDVLTSYSGRTIEVLNTDAEGRLVLADGMTYAKELGASKIIDAATLTGAVGVALGSVSTGVVTNDDAFFARFREAAARTNEYVWQLPSHQEYWDMLKSDVADVRNAIPGGAGTITGGLFVGTFADGLPWIHLDIAGTAFLSSGRGVDPKGATGVMVRTITEYVLSEA